MMKLETAEDVVTKLGGTPAVAELTDVGVTAVCNWRKRNIFPSHTFTTLNDALRATGHEAPRSLWRMSRPERKSA